MTENELELERQAKQRVKGPYDKEWKNYGIPEANDEEQLIDVNRPVSMKKMTKIRDSVDKQMHEVIKHKRGWDYYEKH